MVKLSAWADGSGQTFLRGSLDWSNNLQEVTRRVTRISSEFLQEQTCENVYFEAIFLPTYRKPNSNLPKTVDGDPDFIKKCIEETVQTITHTEYLRH